MKPTAHKVTGGYDLTIIKLKFTVSSVSAVRLRAAAEAVPAELG